MHARARPFLRAWCGGPGEASLHRHGLRRGAGHHLPEEAVPRVQGAEKTRAGGLESPGVRNGEISLRNGLFFSLRCSPVGVNVIVHMVMLVVMYFWCSAGLSFSAFHSCCKIDVRWLVYSAAEFFVACIVVHYENNASAKYGSIPLIRGAVHVFVSMTRFLELTPCFQALPGLSRVWIVFFHLCAWRTGGLAATEKSRKRACCAYVGQLSESFVCPACFTPATSSPEPTPATAPTLWPSQVPATTADANP